MGLPFILAIRRGFLPRTFPVDTGHGDNMTIAKIEQHLRELEIILTMSVTFGLRQILGCQSVYGLMIVSLALGLASNFSVLFK